MSKIDLQLEKDLHDKEDKYNVLIEQFEKQKNIDKEEKGMLLKEIETRDYKISQLEKNVENLINEIEGMKQLKSDKLNFDNNNIIMSKSDNIDLNDHDSHNFNENQL